MRIGASVGIAVFPEDASDMEALCIAADLRMYDAKHEALGTAPTGIACAFASALTARKPPQTPRACQMVD